MRRRLALRALRALRGFRVATATLASFGVLVALATARLVAQGDATSHTVRNATGSLLQTVLEVAVPVVIVGAAIYLFLSHRRRAR